MQNRGNKLLLGFLVFSLLILLVSMIYRQDSSTSLSEEKVNKENPPADLSEEKAHAENPSAGLGEDLLNMNPNTILDHLSGGTQAVGQRKISLESYDLKVETATHWKLPGRLEEISGLAMTLDNQLMAHNDEKAVIHEIDYQNGAIVKAFQLADIKNPENDDFEGIATVNDQVYLVTSSGRIYEGSRGTEGESVLYNIYATGVGRDYEIEGLAYDATQQALLLMCKDARRADLKEQLVIYHWSIDEKQLIEDAHIVIPVIEFTRYIGGKEFQPSGIERHPVSGNYFVLAAGQKAIAEITPRGQVVAAKQFPVQWHRQPEGITFAADGTLIIADEGSGKKARLTLYPVSENR
ncbi:hypothetical protein C6499_01430 [Candidatus Poribacteria bacterium]|nr:MAG: hypothetical protein C6499_01430 [Candidatus Poribacteria bacterium]